VRRLSRLTQGHGASQRYVADRTIRFFQPRLKTPAASLLPDAIGRRLAGKGVRKVRISEPPAARDKVVYVTAYTRFRFGKLEWVCAHFRSWPQG
jgi:hypothetical protein